MKHTLYAIAVAGLMFAPAALAQDAASGCYLNNARYSEGVSISGLTCENAMWVKSAESGSSDFCLHHDLTYAQGAIISIGKPIEVNKDREALFFQTCGAGGNWSELSEKSK